MKLLIGGGYHKSFHLKEFGEALTRHGVEYKFVIDVEVSNGFPSRNVSEWFLPFRKFNKLVNEFKPDAVFVDRQRHFALAAIKANIPLFVHLRGDYWSELKWAKETIYSSPKSRLTAWFRHRITEKCFNEATLILPFSNYLSNIVKNRYPEKKVVTFHQGIDPSTWYSVSGMDLKHPCVGLLQNVYVWGKAKEMLILTKVLEALPNVTFYWAGDGPYRDKVLPILEKYDNFKWLGSLQYPDEVRKFLTEIDVYALVTGYDTLGMTTVEAELMKKPVLVTNVGGTSEAMIDNKTGFLVEKGNPQDWIDKITTLFSDEKLAKRMGEEGHAFVKDSFSWDKISKKFLKLLEVYVMEKKF